MNGYILCERERGDNLLRLTIKCDVGHRFTFMISQLKRQLRVFLWDSKNKAWWTTIYDLKPLSDFCTKHNIELQADVSIVRMYRATLKKHNEVRKLMAKEDAKFKIPMWTDDKNLQLFPYQRAGVKAIVTAQRFLLGDQMGLGKTASAIATMLLAWQRYGGSKALIVCPNRVMEQWQSEINKFTKIPSSRVEVIGTRRCLTGEMPYLYARSATCKQCKFYQYCKQDYDVQKESTSKYRSLQISRAPIAIIGYTTFRMHNEDIINEGYDVIIYDESTKIKTPDAAVTKAAYALTASLPRKAVILLLSGTFIENRLEELYSPITVAEPRIFGPYRAFKSRYLIMDHWGKVTAHQKEGELKDILNGIMLRRTVDEVWKDRPPLMEQVVMCPMGKQQRDIYDTAREGVLKEIEDLEQAGKINMAAIATLMGYLLQISTTVKSIDPGTKMKNHSAKLDQLYEILMNGMDHTGKVVLFTRFSNKVAPHVLEYFRSKQDDIGIALSAAGAIPKKRRKRILKQFKEDPEARILICSDNMAYGVNLQFAKYVVNLDFPWTPATLDQRIARVYRRGQTHGVMVYHFITPDSMEEHVYQLLIGKQDLFASFFKASETSAKIGRGTSRTLSVREMIRAI